MLYKLKINEKPDLIIKGSPVSINTTYRTRSRGRGAKNIYLSGDAKTYKEGSAWQARAMWNKPVITEPIEVTFFYYFKIANKRRDHMNYNKLLCDSLNQIVWKDDSLIQISHHFTFIDSSNPRIEIFINPLKSQTNELI